MNDNPHVDWASMSDVVLMETIGKFIKHHRMNQNRTQEEVSSKAGISRSTLSLLERGETVTISTFIQVIRVLDLLYIMDEFKVDDRISPIDYAKLQQKHQRKRASGSRR